MKTIGLIGGTTWESTQLYYKIINETVREKLGANHSAKILLYSFDFNEIIQTKGDTIKLAELITKIAFKLEKVEADFLLICANTLHIVFNQVQKNINIPILNIIDVTGKEIQKLGVKKVGLLGTTTTMEKNFYKDRLKSKFNIHAIIPTPEERNLIQDVIFNELALGKIKESSKKKLISIINNLIKKGAEGIILGCTEIPLLIQQEDVNIPVFDTTYLHATAAAEKALY
ncbi:MAG: amino acid racemase [Armatimonadetes bacterium]|nr:amino acid racemase [Armatimonadota bacterium]